jgi:hypothetical protein
VWLLARSVGSEARFRNVDVMNASARFGRAAGPPSLLLQIGPEPGRPPDWAAGWTTLADWHTDFGIWGIALFAPPR